MDPTRKDDVAAKFDELMNKSRRKNETCTNNSDVYHEVLDFVFDNINISHVLEEMELEDDVIPNDLTQMTVESCLTQFKSMSRTLSVPLKIISSQVLAQRLIHVVKRDDEDGKLVNCHLFDENAKIKVSSLLNLMKYLVSKNSFDKVNFLKHLPSKDIPMELVWLLNEESLVSFRSFLLCWWEDEDWVEYFCVSIRSLSCDGCLTTAGVRGKIVQVLIGNLISQSYDETLAKDISVKKAKEILFRSVEYVEEKVKSLPPDQTKNWLCLYKVIRELADIPSEMVHTFFHEMLCELLGRPGDLTVEDAMSCQEKWTFEFISGANVMKYQQFIAVLRKEEIIQVFERAFDGLKSEAVDIQVLANLLTVFLFYVEDACKLLDEFLNQCIIDIFESCNFEQFRLVLFLTRQAALEGNHVSPSYSTWFEKTFVTKASLLGLNTKRSIHFLFKSLSDLVPYEKPAYLKTHIFKSPQVPRKLKCYVDDYVSLAKTRLADLNEPLEDSAGIFSSFHGGQNGEQARMVEQAKADVEKVLKLYEESGRVPTTIMEASIFRKPYFIGRFLPALLVPRKPPPESDVRARLIDDLNRAGKIPASMLRSYQRKCDRFEAPSPSDNPGDEVQQLVRSLEKLPTAVLDTVTEAETALGLTSCLSAISRKLKAVFTRDNHASISYVMDIDLASLQVKDDYIQASYALLNAFCRTCAAVQNMKRSDSLAPDRSFVRFRWASKFVSVLFSFPHLIKILYIHLWSTLSHEPHLLRNEHMSGLVILVCHLACSKPGQTRAISLQSTIEQKIKYQSFVDLFSSDFPLTSVKSVQFFARWCCSYLQYAAVAFDNISTNANEVTSDGQTGLCYVPKVMILKIRYLFNKLKFRRPKFQDRPFLTGQTWSMLELVMTSLNDKGHLSDSCIGSFSQWLDWELRIVEDFLFENERQQYYNWAVYEHYLPSLNRVDDAANHREIASQLFSVLMDHYTSATKNGMNRVNCFAEMSLLKILQDIVCLISSGHDRQLPEIAETPSKKPDVWLLDCFAAYSKEVSDSENVSKDIRLCCEIMSFLRLSTLLPPWLLLCNSEWDLLTEQSTKKLSRFLKNYLRPYMFPETLALPFDFTTHLLKAFFASSIKQGAEKDMRLFDIMFSEVIKANPFIFGSLAYYWSQLKPLCSRYVSQSKVLRQLKSYHLWVTSIFDQDGQHGSQCSLPDGNSDEPGIAYAVFLYLKKKSCSLSIKPTERSDMLTRTSKLLDALAVYLRGQKVILYLFDNIMGYLAHLISTGSQVKEEAGWIEISMIILSHSPDVLNVFTQNLQENSEFIDLRSKLTPRIFCKLLPVVFFRIVLHKQANSLLNQTMCRAAFIEALLIMYNGCCNLYTKCSEDPYSMNPRKLLDLELFLEVTKFVKDVLKSVPRSVLQAVPEHLIKSLSSDVRRFFTR